MLKKIVLIILISLIILPSTVNAWNENLPQYPDCTLPEFYPNKWQWLKTQTLTKANSPYCFNRDITLPNEETLTIEAGTVIKFADPYSQGYSSQGAKLYLNGKVYINGTKDEPVVFTSIFDDNYLGDTNNDNDATSPNLGDWDIFALGGQEVNINYAVFKYGGKNLGKMIAVGNGENFSIQHSTITQSWGDGIAVNSNFKNFKYNLIFDNQGSGLKNWGLNETIDARFNWWGSDQGPLIYNINEPDDPNAERIENHFNNGTILFEPWLNSPNETIPLWRQNIEPGDILYDPYTWGVGHTGIYIGNNKVVEAQGTLDGIKLSGYVNENNITKWDYPNRKNVYLLRVKKPVNTDEINWQNIKNNTLEFAKNQIGLPYDWAWLDKSYDTNSASWYCSELVWAAYYNQGINLEHYGDPNSTISPVTPAEIYLDNDTYIVSGHQEYTGGWRDYVFLLVLSPIEVTITDPDGNTMTKDLINIPGAHYLEDVVDASGHTHDQIILPNINGEYKISVTKKSTAEIGETYSLQIKNGDNTLQEVLAQDKIVPAESATHEYNFNPGDSDSGSGFEIDPDTVGSFNDIETSNSNLWTAGTLDIDIFSPNNFTPITPNSSSNRLFQIQNNGSLNSKYKINLNNFSANKQFCNLLHLQTPNYTGLLANFTFDTNLLNSYTNNNLNFQVSLNNNQPEWQNQTCKFDFNLSAWQSNFNNSTLGLSDTEKINNTITSGAWFDPVPTHLIINEVYYDVDSQHGVEYDNEWIEIYNPTDSDVDISAWQICDNNACDILPISDPVPSKGMALILANNSTLNFWNISTSTILIILNDRIGNGLSNLSDRVILRTSDLVQIDAMSYGNDTTAFDSACPDVDEGNSLSRISGPDTDTAIDWIDNTNPNPGL